jgi:transposase
MTISRILSFFAKLVPCWVGIEACETAYYWVREIAKFGRDLRLISPAEACPRAAHGRTHGPRPKHEATAQTRPHIAAVALRTSPSSLSHKMDCLPNGRGPFSS